MGTYPKYRFSNKQQFCIDAGAKIRSMKQDYGNVLKTIKRADGLDRMIRRGDSRENIAKAVASFKQAAARSGPIILNSGLSALGEFGVTQGKRIT